MISNVKTFYLLRKFLYQTPKKRLYIENHINILYDHYIHFFVLMPSQRTTIQHLSRLPELKNRLVTFNGKSRLYFTFVETKTDWKLHCSYFCRCVR